MPTHVYVSKGGRGALLSKEEVIKFMTEFPGSLLSEITCHVSDKLIA